MNPGQPLDLAVRTFDVDGHVDARGVRYIGVATRQKDGTWKALAEVGGALCLVECRITLQEPIVEPREGPWR